MYEMLRVALQQRKAYNLMTIKDSLAEYTLTHYEWSRIAELQDFFAPFATFQKKMPAQKYPTMNLVTTSYNKLFVHLESYERVSKRLYIFSECNIPHIGEPQHFRV